MYMCIYIHTSVGDTGAQHIASSLQRQQGEFAFLYSYIYRCMYVCIICINKK
jgi:hypothetical protein